MKVLLVINNLQLHGAQVLMRNLLLHRNKKIVYFVFVLERINDMEQVEIPNDIPIYFGKGKFNLMTFIHLWQCIKINQPKIIHSQLFPSIFYGILFKAIFFDKRFILTLHSSKTGLDKNLILRFIERSIFNSYDCLISISSEVLDIYRKKYPFLGGKIKLIPNGIIIPNILPLPKKLPKPGEIVNLIMIARFEKSKDHETLLYAISELNFPFTLTLIGDGSRRSRIEKLARELGISDNINFIGLTKNVDRYIREADIGILSSHWEGFGLAAIEIMSYGIPTIVSDVKGMNNVVGDDALKFPPRNHTKLRENIIYLMDKDMYEKMSSRARVRSEMYCISEMILRYEELYEKK